MNRNSPLPKEIYLHDSNNYRSGVTLVEIILAVLFLSFLLGSVNTLMTYSRREATKGFWIQKTIIQLRNGTRLITKKLKETSYPSTILKKSGNQQVVSFKEKRDYDVTGRLRNLELNSKTDFDMHAMITSGGTIVPLPNNQQVMYFPICKPEKDFASGYEEGSITWVELLLKPSPDYKITGSGDLYLIERKDSYNTTGKPYRAFSLSGKKFDAGLPISNEKLIVSDVRGIAIDSYDIEELRGVFVTKTGQKYQKTRVRILVTFEISCRHPKDTKTWLSDQCSIINNVGLVKVVPTSLMELVSVNVSAGTASILVDGQPKSCAIGGTVGGYKVVRVISDAVVLRLPGAKFDRYVTKRSE